MGNIVTSGPNEAAIVSGGCWTPRRIQVVIGGWCFAPPFTTNIQRLSLQVMTLHPVCNDAESVFGVALTVTGVAQCKIIKTRELLLTAAEQFLGKSIDEVKDTLLHSLEGHLRAIIGTLTVEEIYRDREMFASNVRQVASPDMGHMGIEILSFTIKDIYDNNEYLASLGRAQTALVKRDADIGVAQANRDAGIREAECEKLAMDVKYETDTKIQNNYKLYQLQKAQFDQEVNAAKAQAELAYELQVAKIKQKIRWEELEIDVIERRKQIEVEEQEIKRNFNELAGSVYLPADAEKYCIEVIAEGKKTQVIQAAMAARDKILLMGEREAGRLQRIGNAEALRMQLKAEVYRQYGDAAMLSLVLDALPKIAAEVAAPLAKTNEIVLVGGSEHVSGDVNKLVAQLPPAIHALTGLNINKSLMNKLSTSK